MLLIRKSLVQGLAQLVGYQPSKFANDEVSGVWCMLNCLVANPQKILSTKSVELDTCSNIGHLG